MLIEGICPSEVEQESLRRLVRAAALRLGGAPQLTLDEAVELAALINQGRKPTPPVGGAAPLAVALAR